jgi:hypothetical protein
MNICMHVNLNARRIMQDCLQIIVWQSFITTCIILGNMAMQLRKYGQGLPRISCTSVGVCLL